LLMIECSDKLDRPQHVDDRAHNLGLCIHTSVHQQADVSCLTIIQPACCSEELQGYKRPSVATNEAKDCTIAIAVTSQSSFVWSIKQASVQDLS
jgi:hypothetical protein